MLSNAFAQLRAKYPEDFLGLDVLEQCIEKMLNQYRNAVIDVDIIQGQTGIDVEKIHDVLVALVSVGSLQPRLFWSCPNELGTVMEADTLSEFPTQIDCSVCGTPHRFDKRDVEIFFLSTSDSAFA